MVDSTSVVVPPPIPSLRSLVAPSLSTSTHGAVPASKRADLLSLKLRLAQLLPPDQGHYYWSSLVEFITGKINRHELGQVLEEVLVGGHSDNASHDDTNEAVQLHNALLLSILYNTTRISTPPSTLRHSGFQKRRRGATDDTSLDPSVKRLKSIVMAINKRERQELKQLGSQAASAFAVSDAAQAQAIRDAGGVMTSAMAKREAERERDRRREKEQVQLRTLGASLDSRKGKVGLDGVPTALVEGGKAVAPNLPQDYQRCVGTPLCCEARLLPDVETLKDRMTLVAYESGLSGGADSRAASLGVQAIETHLKNMIANVIGLVRSNREKGVAIVSKEQLKILEAAKPLPRETNDDVPSDADDQSTSAEATATDDRKPKTKRREEGSQSTSTASVPVKSEYPIDSIKAVQLLSVASRSASSSSSDDENDPPLSSHDFGSLFEINPSVLVSARLAAVERLFARPPDSDDSDSDDGSDTDSGSEADDESIAMAVDSVTTSISTNSNGTGRVSGKSRAKLAPMSVHSPLSSSRPPRLSRTGSLSRPPTRHRGSRSNSLTSNNTVGGGKRDQYVIDPSAVLIPQGHPDVAHPRLSILVPTTDAHAGSGSRPASATPSAGGAAGIATPTAGGLSPKSLALRHQLFPELSDEPSNSSNPGPGAEAGGGPGSPSNNTSTDGGSESEDNAHPSTMDGHGDRVPGQAGPERPGSRGGSGAAGRKQLWEVVDSVRLLDGVL